MTAAAAEAAKPEPTRAPPQQAPIPGMVVSPPPAIDPELFTADAPVFPPAVLEALSEPIDPSVVEVRPFDGTLYAPWVHYQRVLLKAFKPGGYKMVPRGPVRTEGNVITWQKALFVRVPGETRFQFIKEAKGECRSQGGMTAGNAAEGAHSDALVKCCKELGIFMELFDPSWRRWWEKEYKAKHEAAMKSAKRPESRSGDAAPVALASSNGSQKPSAAPEPKQPTATPAASDGVTSSDLPEPTSPLDTGEAATADQKDAIRTHIRQRKWKRGYVRLWFVGLFGVQADDPLEALTQVQADAAFTLLLAHGTGAYEKLLAEERAKGTVL